MRFQIDTTLKTIKVEANVNFGELINVLDKMLPCSEWRSYTLETNTVINWANPVVIDPYGPQPNWWQYPIVSYAAMAAPHSTFTFQTIN